MPLTESELAKIVVQLQQPGEPYYWWIPVNHDAPRRRPQSRSGAPEPALSDERHSANIIRRMLTGDDPILTFHKGGPFTTARPDGPRVIERCDLFCVYQVGKGIVAQGWFASGVGHEPNHRNNPHLGILPMVAHVQRNPVLYLDDPIGVGQHEKTLESRTGMNAHKRAFMRGVTHPITLRDFMLLTSRSR
jgi:hypothetical protein